MANMWTILGLDQPTSDLKTIKKAYALKLRETRPDEDTEGFIALRNAFEAAKNWANSKPQSIQKVRFTYGNFTYQNHTNDLIVSQSETKKELQDNGLTTTLDNLKALINHKTDREQMFNWQHLITQSLELSLDDYSQFERNLVIGLLEVFGFYEDPDGDFDSKLYTIPVKLISKQMGWDRGSFSVAGISHDINWLHEYAIKGVRKKVAPIPKQKNSDFPVWIILCCVIFFSQAASWFQNQNNDGNQPNYRAVIEMMGQNPNFTSSETLDTLNSENQNIYGRNPSLSHLPNIEHSLELQKTLNEISALTIEDQAPSTERMLQYLNREMEQLETLDGNASPSTKSDEKKDPNSNDY